MIPHVTDTELDAFIQRTASASDLVKIDQHIAGCADCRARMQARAGRALGWLQREINGSSSEDHLSFDAIAALAEGNDVPEAREHLRACSRCQAEVDDLTQAVRSDRERPGAAPAKPRRLQIWAIAAGLCAVSLIPVWWKLTRTAPSLASMTASVNDAGGTVGVDQNGVLHSSRAFAQSDADMVKAALQSGALEVQGIAANLGRKQEQLLGAPSKGNAFALEKPVAEAVLTDRPAFAWAALAGASSYRVSVYDEKFRKVMESPELTANSWIAVELLPRASVYSWTVTARLGQTEIREPIPPAPEAKFVVLGQDEVDRLRETQRRYPDSHLLLATLFAKAGAVDDARQQLRILESQNPGSPVVLRLESSLGSER